MLTVPATLHKTASTVIPFLDVLRGVAALAVVLHHASSIMMANQPGLAAVFPYSVTEYGIYGVEIFFVISGYCIAAAAINTLDKGKSVGDFAWARARRIYPSYWSSLAFYLLIAFAMAFLVRKGVLGASNMAEAASHINGASVLTNATLTQFFANQPVLSVVSWTLCYEIAFYAICAALLAASQSGKNAPRSFLWGCHNLTAMLLLAQAIVPGGLRYPLDMWAMFGFGVVAYHSVRSERSAASEKREVGWVAGVFVLLTLFVAIRGLGAVVSPHRHSVMLSFGIAAVTALIVFAVRNTSPDAVHRSVWRPFAFLGGFSYSLYLVHFLCLGLANQATRFLKLPSSLHLLHYAILLGVALIGGYLFYRLFELPWLRQKPGATNKSPLPNP